MGEGPMNNKMWIGVAIGAAIGLGYAMTRQRKPTKWSSAREVSRSVAEGSGDLVEQGKNIIDHIRVIYDEGRKVVDEASDLWEHGRKLVRV